MYGFHKINRTPRNQKQSAAAATNTVADPSSQKWEFSHPKFLRGRIDLLEDIKRKTIETDAAAGGASTSGGRHGRVELPSEVARQLRIMRKDYEEVVIELKREQEKVGKVVNVLRVLWEGVRSSGMGMALPPFPSELLERATSISPPNSATMDGFNLSPDGGPRAMKLAGNRLVPASSSPTHGSATVTPPTPTSAGIGADANSHSGGTFPFSDRGRPRTSNAISKIVVQDSDGRANKRSKIEPQEGFSIGPGNTHLSMSTGARRGRTTGLRGENGVDPEGHTIRKVGQRA